MRIAAVGLAIALVGASSAQPLQFDPQQKTAWIHKEWKASEDARFVALGKRLKGQIKKKEDAVRLFDTALSGYSTKRSAENTYQLLYILSEGWFTDEEKSGLYRKAQLSETLLEWSSPASFQYARVAFIATANATNGTMAPATTVRRLYKRSDGDLALERSLVDVMSTLSGLQKEGKEWMFAKASELFRRTGEYLDARHRIQAGNVRVFYYGTKKVADEEIGFLRRVEETFPLTAKQKQGIQRGISELVKLKKNLK